MTPVKATPASLPRPHLRAFATFILFMPTAALAGVPLSKDACQRLSDGAKITQTKALVIAYEGLLSSRPHNANKLASYREKLAQGLKARRPLFDPTGSWLVRGPLVRIVENYKNKVQVLAFGRTGMTSAGSIPATCAETWMSAKGEGTEGRKVILVGHSFGGGAAWELASSLQSKGVTIDSVITADPRSPKQCMGECWNWAKPSNVKVWENYYQSIPLRGHPVPGANNHFMGAVGHGFIQNVPGVYQSIANRIEGLSSPITTAAYEHINQSSSGGEGSYITGGSNSQSLDEAQSNAATEKRVVETRKASGGTKPFSFFGNAGTSAYAPGGFCGPGTACEKRWFDRGLTNTSGGSVLGKKIDAPTGIFTYFKPDNSLDLKTPELKRDPFTPNKANPVLGTLDGSSSDSQIVGSSAGESDLQPKVLDRANATEMMSGLWPLSKGEAAAPKAKEEPFSLTSFKEGADLTSAFTLDGLDSEIRTPAGAIASKKNEKGTAHGEELSLFARVHGRYRQLQQKL